MHGLTGAARGVQSTCMACVSVYFSARWCRTDSVVPSARCVTSARLQGIAVYRYTNILHNDLDGYKKPESVENMSTSCYTRFKRKKNKQKTQKNYVKTKFSSLYHIMCDELHCFFFWISLWSQRLCTSDIYWELPHFLKKSEIK